MKALFSWPVLLVVVALDRVTKMLAETLLPPNGFPERVMGDAVRLALVYNPGAAFGLYLGSYSRWIFMALTLGALVILWRLYRQTAATEHVRALAIALVASGAIGNLLDRLRSDRGVVDFIDVGVGLHRWPTFNVADMAVSGGAFLLAYVLWGEEQRESATVVTSGTDRSSSGSVEAP
ncbi:MAG: signal peptidase II [Gemmatimonadaceae bacterium]|nr:signal peptidase II [Gemmatimonadaceae bacterium]